MRKTACLCTFAWLALTSTANPTDLDPDALISDIRYNYEIMSGCYDGEYWAISRGTLSMSIEVPESADGIIFFKACGPTVKYKYPPFYNIRTPLDISGKTKIDVEYKEVTDDNYFKVGFIINDTAYFSSHFAVKDLIAPEDLERLNGTDSCIGVTEDNLQMEISGRILSIKCEADCAIDIASIDGKNVFSNIVSKDTDIPLEAGIYVVRITNNNTSLTKKINIR